MDFHPVSAIFPMMDATELHALVADIRENGLIEPILTHDGLIVDGRNRYQACLQAGVSPRYQEWEGGGSLVSLIISLNLKRRHLTASQKAAVAVDLLPHLEAEARERQLSTLKRGTESPDTAQMPERAEARELAGEALGVSPRYVSEAKRLSQEAPELFEAVKAGAKTITQARREAIRQNAPETPEMPSGKYRVIYADPPWSYGNTQPDYHTEQSDHYPTMPLAEICAMPVAEITEDDAVLFLWVTSPMLPESFDVVKAWGFKYKASFVWDKVRHNMGHYNSVRHEFLLICVKGSCQPDVTELFDSVQSIERTTHSRKPPEFREIIDAIYPIGQRIELFATERVDGWDRYGNEVYHA